MARLIHVSIGVPVGGAEDEAGFLVGFLGYTRMALSPDSPLTSKRFECADGTQIHLSEDANHQAPDRAHVAIDLGDDLAEVERRFDAADYQYEVFEYPTYRLVWCRDPAGNRWELRGTPVT